MLKLRSNIIVTSILGVALLSACSNHKAANDNHLFHDSGNTINVTDRQDLYNKNKTNTMKKRTEEFGYVRHQKSPIAGAKMNYKDIYAVDREKVADTISKMNVGSLPHVFDCSTLVTDHEVLMAYKTDVKGKKARNEVADQVKRTALSVVPGWYHVYVTDDPTLMRNVENIASMDANMDNVHNVVADTVKLMLERSPQGHVLSKGGVNENNEMTGETNDMIDKDEYNNELKKSKLKTPTSKDGMME
ncbi:YhcN/YlaJ family sporulation lipoprotein [Falsibacillus albus]|uniref:YhcN/YlaJ family sporulation lipoprotein n=1 Tax=Falsibacillus albus TaxID=2478915 RepID=UPI0038996090